MTDTIHKSKSVNGLPALLHSKERRCLRLPLSKLPSELQGVKKHCNAYRLLIESECIARYGSITTTKASLIQTAIRFEQLAKTIERIAKDNWDALDPLDQAALIDRIGRYSQQRDAAIAKLDLDTDGSKLGNALDIMFTPPTEGTADGS